MIIQICSQAEAIALAGSIPMKTSIISITSKEDGDVLFPDNSNIDAVLNLKLNDLTQDVDEEGIPYGRPLPKAEDLTGLKAFVEGLSCDCLIVHCWEGVSRSAAVAKAIYEFRGKTDVLRADRALLPNPLVYTLARWELKHESSSLRKKKLYAD